MKTQSKASAHRSLRATFYLSAGGILYTRDGRDVTDGRNGGKRSNIIVRAARCDPYLRTIGCGTLARLFSLSAGRPAINEEPGRWDDTRLGCAAVRHRLFSHLCPGSLFHTIQTSVPRGSRSFLNGTASRFFCASATFF